MASTPSAQVLSSSMSDILNNHLPKLHRIIEECLDVSFALCNNEMNEFGISKIFDIFNQLITTAFVLDTGYWAFFNSIRGQCLCICGRYGTVCRHIRNNNHWIDMESVPSKANDGKFYPKHFGQVCPSDYNIRIEPVNDMLGYQISINLTLEYKRLGRGRPRRMDKEKREACDPRMNKQKCTTTIFARYNLTSEFYPSMQHSVVFQPSPFYHDYYGSYFKKLLETRMMLKHDERYFSVPIHAYKASIVLLNVVNVPLYTMSSQIYAIIPPVEEYKHKLSRSKRPRAETMYIAPCHDETVVYQRQFYDGDNMWKYPDPMTAVSTSMQPITIDDSEDIDYHMYTYEKRFLMTDRHLPDLSEDIKPMLESLKLKYNNAAEYDISSSDEKCKYYLPSSLTTDNEGLATSSEKTSIKTETNADSSKPMLTPCIDEKTYSEVLKTPTAKTRALIKEFDSLYPNLRPKYIPRTKVEKSTQLNLIQDVIIGDMLKEQLKPDYLKTYLKK